MPILEATFLGWVISTNGEAHALYLNSNNEPIYWCGDVFYSLTVSEQPRTTGMDVRFCSNCRRLARTEDHV